jgi:hypothetical protein
LELPAESGDGNESCCTLKLSSRYFFVMLY